MTEPKWKVGDTVIVSGRWVRNGSATISKIGRKFFYLEGDNRETPYQISDGKEKPSGYAYDSWVETPEDYEARKVREDVLDKLREHGVRWGDSWGTKMWQEKNLSTARLMELLAFCDSVAAEIALVDLDV